MAGFYCIKKNGKLVLPGLVHPSISALTKIKMSLKRC